MTSLYQFQFTTSSEEQSKRLLCKTSPSGDYTSPLGFFVERLQPWVNHGRQEWSRSPLVSLTTKVNVCPFVFEHVSSLVACLIFPNRDWKSIEVRQGFPKVTLLVSGEHSGGLCVSQHLALSMLPLSYWCICTSHAVRHCRCTVNLF